MFFGKYQFFLRKIFGLAKFFKKWTMSWYRPFLCYFDHFFSPFFEILMQWNFWNFLFFNFKILSPWEPCDSRPLARVMQLKFRLLRSLQLQCYNQYLWMLDWDSCTQICSEDADCPTDMVCNGLECVLQIVSTGLCESDNDYSNSLVCDNNSGLCKCSSEVFWFNATSLTCNQHTIDNGPCLIDEHCPGIAQCHTDVGVCYCNHDLI